MKIRELLEKAKKAHSINPDADVGIWIWEDYAKSMNRESCIAENAEIVDIFNGAFVISCDKKESTKKFVNKLLLDKWQSDK